MLHANAIFLEPRRGASNPLKLELQVVANCLMWVLGKESLPLQRAARLLTIHLPQPLGFKDRISLYVNQSRLEFGTLLL